MDDQELARRARALGLEALAARFPDELRKALEGAAALAGKLPRDLHWTEEPAHVFSRAADAPAASKRSDGR
jgi:hypothetical protein